MFASPLGVMLAVPLLVVSVGVTMGTLGQSNLTDTIEAMATDRFGEQSQRAVEHLQSKFREAEGLLGEFHAFLDRRPGQYDATRLADRLSTWMTEREWIAFMSLGTIDGDFIGVYRNAAGDLLVSHRTVEDDGRSPLVDSAINIDGELVAVREDEDSGYDVRTRPYFVATRARDARIWTEPYIYYDSGLPGVTCAEPVYDSRGGFHGVITVDLSLNSLSEFVEGLTTVEGGKVFVFNAGLQILAYPGFRRAHEQDQGGQGDVPTYLELADADELVPYFQALDDQIGPPSDIDAATSFAFDFDSGRVLANVLPAQFRPNLRWFVGAMAPESVFLAPAVSHRSAAITTNFIALGAALLVASLFAFALVRARDDLKVARASATQAQKKLSELGSYELVRKLGEGGMGEVWLGRHQMLARPAAVKLIKPNTLREADASDAEQLLARFEREARVTANLNSPNTVRLFDFGINPDGVFFLVMEYLDGIDLHEMVMSFGPQPPGRVINLLIQVCSSLAEAHDIGLVHRDIKPANIFACRLGDELDVVKVLDFGLVIDVEHDARLTDAGHVAGTPAFMAPEQIFGEDIDGRTDLYAVGCVAYWLLTGEPVFVEGSASKMMMAHAYNEPPVPSDKAKFEVPLALNRLVLACLAKKREDRPQSARELADLLRAVEVPVASRFNRGALVNWWMVHRPVSARDQKLFEQEAETRMMSTRA